ncbi:MAG: methionine--tRNA ligase, partial [Thermoplasmata archaeon]
MPRIFVATSWPYANGPIHIGQFASTYLPADIFARYHRLVGDEVLMVSGSDMHGTPILVQAEAQGTTPEAVAGRFHEVHRETFARAGISFDLYTTTHTENHARTVAEVFLRLLEQGSVRRRTAEGPYCPKHRRFLPDRYARGRCPHCGSEDARGDECDRCGRPVDVRELGEPRCALCGTPAEFRPSEHFYLELDRLQEAVAAFVAERPHWRAGTRRVTENFLAEGLHPTSISRDLDWGVPIPLDGYEGKRLYVWFEALIGYLSATREWAIRARNPGAWHRYWDAREPVRQYYFIGKDNRFFHTIVWPAMLLGVGGLQVPYDVPANEWMNLGGAKLSKSRSGGFDVFLPSLLDRYPADVVRFYAAHLAPQNHDTEFDPEEFERVREEILAHQLGNLVQRTLVLVRDHAGGAVPDPGPGWSEEALDGPGPAIARAHAAIGQAYDRVLLKEALDAALEEVRAANRAFHDAEPWRRTGTVQHRILYETVWRLRAIATWLAPVLPSTAERIHRMLGFAGPPARWEDALRPVPPGQPLGPVAPLFPRADPGERPGPPAATARSPSSPTREPARAPGPPPAPAPLGIRAAVIREA